VGKLERHDPRIRILLAHFLPAIRPPQGRCLLRLSCPDLTLRAVFSAMGEDRLTNLFRQPAPAVAISQEALGRAPSEDEIEAAMALLIGCLLSVVVGGIIPIAVGLCDRGIQKPLADSFWSWVFARETASTRWAEQIRSATMVTGPRDRRECLSRSR
jgi:hypothetical protein